jgi:hypothetical protein
MLRGLTRCWAYAQTEAPSYHAEDGAAELARSSADDALLLCSTVLPACGDVAAVLKSSLGTGTNFEIAATDQIRPIATTMPSPMAVRICIPHFALNFAKVSHISRGADVKQVTLTGRLSRPS